MTVRIERIADLRLSSASHLDFGELSRVATFIRSLRNCLQTLWELCVSVVNSALYGAL
jgi:hypothetical protein